MVFFEDECHLLWGDLCGYGWGKTDERLEVPVVNERSKQTYYGALNLCTQEFCIQALDKGNSQATICFIETLRAQHPEARIALIWDGASYHRSQALKDYLATLNQDLEESQWQVTCKRFAPNDPRQNPVEDIWLQAKRLIREFYYLCRSFAAMKCLFEFATNWQTFDFPKLFMYGKFSRLT